MDFTKWPISFNNNLATLKNIFSKGFQMHVWLKLKAAFDIKEPWPKV